MAEYNPSQPAEPAPYLSAPTRPVSGSATARDHRRDDRSLLGEPVLYDVVAKRLATGDINGDGRADLVAIADGAVWAWLTRGHHLEPPRRYAFDGLADVSAIGDLNDDGFDDVVLHENPTFWGSGWFVTVLPGSRHGFGTAFPVDVPRDDYSYPVFTSLTAAGTAITAPVP